VADDQSIDPGLSDPPHRFRRRQEVSHRLVELEQPVGNLIQRLRVVNPTRPRRRVADRFAFDEGEDLALLLVDPQETRRAEEALILEMPE